MISSYDCQRKEMMRDSALFHYSSTMMLEKRIIILLSCRIIFFLEKGHCFVLISYIISDVRFLDLTVLLLIGVIWSYFYSKFYKFPPK